MDRQKIIEEQKKRREEENKNIQKNLNLWKRRCKQDWKTVGNHLHKERKAAPDVTMKGKPLLTRAETCEAIKQHAQDLIKTKEDKMKDKGITREMQIDSIVKEIKKKGNLKTTIDWKNPTGEEIHAKMKESKGAGSTDGWHGKEIRHFPLEVAEAFSEIAKRWREVGKAPKAMKIARQAALVKESKIKKETNTIEAGDLRPISVISTWWRIITGCWVQSEAIAEWKKHYIPEEVIYEGQCTESCAAVVIERYHKRGFLGTLDFSLCYDHIDPKLICEALRKLEIPKNLIDMLEDVWSQIKRYVEYEGECSETPFKAGAMIMQGDSFGPFALHVLMAAGVAWVKEKMENETQEEKGNDAKKKETKKKETVKTLKKWEMLVYMDDRNLTADDPDTLSKLVQKWQEWSDFMGLLENGKKQD